MIDPVVQDLDRYLNKLDVLQAYEDWQDIDYDNRKHISYKDWVVLMEDMRAADIADNMRDDDR